MASGDIKNAYASPTTGTGVLSVTPLASSSTWTGACIFFYVNNSSNVYTDYRISGQITVGTTPTINTEIRMYLVASDDNSTWPDGLSSTPGDDSFTSEGVRDGFAKLAAVLRVDSTTSSRAYPYEFNAQEVFGGSVPKGFICVVAHNTGTALHSTAGNHTYSYAAQYLNVTP